ncbi:MAG: oxidoreductase [Chitinophagaceae bacterium]
MKKVIIIGATSGIGLELAKIYTDHGHFVGATGRRQELLTQLEQSLPGKIITERFDVTAENNIAHLKKLIEKLGGMDVLIYNSGFGDVSATLDWKLDRQTTLTNVNGFVEIVNYAFNFFVQQGYGQIAATSSVAANRGNSWAPAYSASKAFMSVYMEGLYMKAKKMKGHNGRPVKISVTDIQPGFVNTKLAKGNKQFWVSKVEKAARQIFHAIEKGKRKAYVTKRWAIIAFLMRWVPMWIYRRVS